jgi:hypothetical protein
MRARRKADADDGRDRHEDIDEDLEHQVTIG